MSTAECICNCRDLARQPNFHESMWLTVVKHSKLTPVFIRPARCLGDVP